MLSTILNYNVIVTMTYHFTYCKMYSSIELYNITTRNDLVIFFLLKFRPIFRNAYGNELLTPYHFEIHDKNQNVSVYPELLINLKRLTE